jgi:predicted RNA polymerase sigma factor
VDEALLRTLTPTVIGILVRRGADFAAAEDAVQDALDVLQHPARIAAEGLPWELISAATTAVEP